MKFKLIVKINLAKLRSFAFAFGSLTEEAEEEGTGLAGC